MPKLLHLKDIHDFENAKSGLISRESYAVRMIEPRMFSLGQNWVDEFTLWTIAKQIENEAKNPNSK
jgi:hypothetical protein